MSTPTSPTEAERIEGIIISIHGGCRVVDYDLLPRCQVEAAADIQALLDEARAYEVKTYHENAYTMGEGKYYEMRWAQLKGKGTR